MLRSRLQWGHVSEDVETRVGDVAMARHAQPLQWGHVSEDVETRAVSGIAVQTGRASMGPRL